MTREGSEGFSFVVVKNIIFFLCFSQQQKKQHSYFEKDRSCLDK